MLVSTILTSGSVRKGTSSWAAMMVSENRVASMGIVTVVIGLTVRASSVPDLPSRLPESQTFVNFHPRTQAPAKSVEQVHLARRFGTSNLVGSPFSAKDVITLVPVKG